MVAQLSGELKCEDITEALGKALATTKALTNGYRQSADQATQASRKLSDRKNELEVVSESVDELVARLKNLREQREEVAEALGLAEGRARSVADHRKALEDCALGIKAASVAIGAIDEPPDEETIEKRVAELNDEAEKLEKIEEPRNPVAGESQSRLDAATADLAAKEVATTEQLQRVVTARTALKSATLQFDAHANGPWMRCLEIARGLGGPIGEAFPVDSEPKRLWGELATIIATNAEPATVEEHREAVRNAEGDVATAEESLKPLTHAHEEARREFNEASDAHANALVAFEADYKRHRDAQCKVRDLRAKADLLRTTVDETRQNIKKQQKDLTNLRSKQLQHEERLKALLDESSSESVESMQQRADALATEIETLEARVKAKQAYQQLEGELARCAASAERERVNHETAKRLADAIRAQRDQIMVDLVKPLAERMNKFLGWSGIYRRAYCRLENDRGSPAFELGWVVDDTLRIPLPAMSGGESVIFTAALAYAIVDLADPPLKLLLLEIAEVDGMNLERLAKALVEVGKNGMQVIAATHLLLLPERIPDGINLIMCSASQGKRAELVGGAV
jgi:DNA repair exonuclease SbcCD ATPase subunit